MLAYVLVVLFLSFENNPSHQCQLFHFFLGRARRLGVGRVGGGGVGGVGDSRQMPLQQRTKDVSVAMRDKKKIMRMGLKTNSV